MTSTLWVNAVSDERYLIVEGAEGGGLDLAIHSAAPGTGYMQVNADGSVKKVFPR
jgi:serine/threonine-protein kinase